MPAKILKIVAKTKTDLKSKYSKTIKKAYKDGFVYVKDGYDDNRVKRVKGGYELSITVHT